MRKTSLVVLALLILPLIASKSYDPTSLDAVKLLTIEASTKEERTQIAALGISIESVFKDYIVALAQDAEIAELVQLGLRFKARPLPAYLLDFPPEDSDFHNLSELNAELKKITEAYPHIASLEEIGKSLEGRPLYIVRISAVQKEQEPPPAILFLGTHHAREHLSTEVPLFLIKHLVENYGRNEEITAAVNNKEIWIMPMVNPDGADYDVQDPPYKWWRKNRREENGKTFGVDLNRNYSFKWGGGGSSDWRYSQTYRGTEPFSEPETQAIKAFVEAHKNVSIILSYHSFSELVLYPWGHTYDSIEDDKALHVHEIMAQEMGRMTGYTPQQSSDLYITTGDTTDWAFGEHGIISFTIELYPATLGDGGFYPSASQIQPVVNKNIPAALYLIQYADNPYRVLRESHYRLTAPKIMF